MGHLALMVDDADRTAAQRVIDAYERGDLAIDADEVE
jgi:hypothetical protein